MSARQGMRAVGAAVVLVWTFGSGCGGPPPAPEAPPTEKTTPEPAGDVATASSAKVQEGIDAIQAGDYSAAKAALEEAHTADPKDAQAAFYLGVALQNLDDPEGAMAKYQAALDNDPKLLEAIVNLSGMLLDVKNQPDEALALIEKGLAIDAKNPDLHRNKALALYDKKDVNGALQALTPALELQPDDAELRFMRAGLLAHTKKRDEAIAELQKIELADADISGRVANMYRQLKDNAGCVAAFDKAIGFKPSSVLHVKRGLCKKGLKDAAGEKADYEKALELDPNDAFAHMYLGHHLCAAGDKKGGQASFKKALEVGKGDRFKDQVTKAAAKCK